MPIYEYRCPSCGRFEQLQKVSDPPLQSCPRCESKGEKHSVERLVSSAAFHLKGSGWYKTDYKSSGSQGSSSVTKKEDAGSVAQGGEKPSESKGESKGESKSEAKVEKGSAE